jgi:hypothetical protein
MKYPTFLFFPLVLGFDCLSDCCLGFTPMHLQHQAKRLKLAKRQQRGRNIQAFRLPLPAADDEGASFISEEYQPPMETGHLNGASRISIPGLLGLPSPISTLTTTAVAAPFSFSSTHPQEAMSTGKFMNPFHLGDAAGFFALVGDVDSESRVEVYAILSKSLSKSPTLVRGKSCQFTIVTRVIHPCGATPFFHCSSCSSFEADHLILFDPKFLWAKEVPTADFRCEHTDFFQNKASNFKPPVEVAVEVPSLSGGHRLQFKIDRLQGASHDFFLCKGKKGCLDWAVVVVSLSAGKASCLSCDDRHFCGHRRNFNMTAQGAEEKDENEVPDLFENRNRLFGNQRDKWTDDDGNLTAAKMCHSAKIDPTYKINHANPPGPRCMFAPPCFEVTTNDGSVSFQKNQRVYLFSLQEIETFETLNTDEDGKHYLYRPLHYSGEKEGILNLDGTYFFRWEVMFVILQMFCRQSISYKAFAETLLSKYSSLGQVCPLQVDAFRKKLEQACVCYIILRGLPYSEMVGI